MKNVLIIIYLAITILACRNSDEKTNTTENNFQQNTTDTLYYINKGKEIAQASFSTLSNKLKQAIQNGGIENAISYCNIHALPLTDSLSNVFGVKIQRISHKPRNIKNTADSSELKIINNYILSHNEKPTLVTNKSNVIFYAPIYTKPLCLTCHGTVGGTINSSTYEKIKTLYPDDKATGFKIDDLRGLWKITFEVKN
jgi:hypothetical protein